MKNSILDFGTRCPECGQRLFFDIDGEGFCQDCTRWAVATVEPYVALVGSEFVESADTRDELLAVLEEILDDKGAEDVCVWHGLRVVLILHADGRVTDFGGPG